MFCPNCGTQVPDGVKFCPTCGTQMQEQQESAPAPAPAPIPAPTFTEPAQNSWSQPVGVNNVPNPQPYQAVYQEPTPAPVQGTVDDGGASTPILVMGIIGLVTAFAPWMASIIGIIVSAIARGKAKNYKARFGGLFGKAKVGANLAKAGLIVAIIMTIIWFIIIIVLAILAAVAGTDFSDVFNSMY